MIKFNKLAQIAKRYEFEDSVAETDVYNGAFGAVDTDGVFAPVANASKAVMQLEVGDDMDMPKYEIPKGTRLRIVDLEAFNGEKVEIYDYPLPDTYAVGDKLVSNSEGALEVDAAAVAPYFEINEIIGIKQGVKVTVVAQ